MRVGSIIRADNSGLGTLAREFWDNGLIHKAIIQPNGVYRTFPERFPESQVGLTVGNIQWLLQDIDILLIFETPFKWEILTQARARGVKTVFMPMHEGLPEHPPYLPDLWIAPSDLEMEMGLSPVVRLNVPVNTDRIKWRLREKAMTFVHNAGHGGIDFRNGTPELIEAFKLIKNPDVRLIIRSQAHNFSVDQDPRIEFRYGNYLNYWDMWGDGDVFVFPEKFNGLSLPIQEAVASGMPVIATDRRPFNNWLPKELLIQPSGFRVKRVSRRIEQAEHNYLDIARMLRDVIGQDVSKYSLWGKEWAEQNSWKVLKSEYEKVFNKLIDGTDKK